MMIKQLSPLQLKNRIDQQEPLLLLDVREPFEYQYARIDNSVSMPLNQLQERLHELDPEQEMVMICHHGIRSLQAALFLEQSGFNHISNLSGGIDAWSCQCDSTVLRY